MSGRAFVVAICGPPGSGKSSLVRALAARLGGAPVIEYDAYEEITAWPPEAVEAWLMRGAPFAEIPVPDLARDLGRLAAGEAVRDRVSGGMLRARPDGARPAVVIFETLLGRAHESTRALIDHLVWLDVPADVALARKLQALMGAARTGRVEANGVVAHVEGYLAHYARLMRPIYALQRERARGEADQILDATAQLAVLAAAVDDAVSAREAAR